MSRYPLYSIALCLVISCGGSSSKEGQPKDTRLEEIDSRNLTICGELNRIFDRILELHLTARPEDGARLYVETMNRLIDNYSFYLNAEKNAEVKNYLSEFLKQFRSNSEKRKSDEIYNVRKNCGDIKQFESEIRRFRHLTTQESEVEFTRDVYRTFLEEFAPTLDTFSSYIYPETSSEKTYQFGIRVPMLEESNLQHISDSVEVFSTLGPRIPLKPGDRIEAIYSITNDQWLTVREILEDDAAGVWSLDKAFHDNTNSVLRVRLSNKTEVTLPSVGDANRPSLARAQVINKKYIVAQLLSFEEGAAQDLRRAILSAKGDSSEIKGIILDLRYNSGGADLEATEVASLFINEGLLYRQKSKNEIYSVSSKSEGASASSGFFSEPLVVIVNRFSKSNGEFVPAILKDADRALVVGETTYGKGVGTFFLKFDVGSQIGGKFKLTEEIGYTRSGTTPQEFGLDPQIIVNDKKYLAKIETCRAKNGCRDLSVKDRSKIRNSPIVPNSRIEAFGSYNPRGKIYKWQSATASGIESSHSLDTSEDAFMDTAIMALNGAEI